MVLLIAFISNAQSIYKSSIDAGGASASNGNIQVFYTIGEVNVQESSAGNIVLSEGFISAAFKVSIHPKVYLQGPILSPETVGLMNDDLRAVSYLPTTSPYADNAIAAASVFNLGGTSVTGLAQDDIVDWVWLELRAADDNTKLINAQSALLQRDGDIVALDGVTNLSMTAAPADYYVVVMHRNHLGIMTANVITLSDTPSVIDFTNNTSQITYGSNAQTIYGMPTGKVGMWAGNVGGDTSVRYQGSGNDTNSIKDAVLADTGNTTSSNLHSFTGYNVADVNLDGTVRYQGSGNDANTIKDVILAHPDNQSSPSNLFLILEQLPEN